MRKTVSYYFRYILFSGGGTGFIGRNLGDLLAIKGYNVTNVARMPGANNISWTNLEKCGLPKSFAVVNLAGQQFMDFTKSWTPGLANISSQHT